MGRAGRLSYRHCHRQRHASPSVDRRGTVFGLLWEWEMQRIGWLLGMRLLRRVLWRLLHEILSHRTCRLVSPLPLSLPLSPAPLRSHITFPPCPCLCPCLCVCLWRCVAVLFLVVRFSEAFVDEIAHDVEMECSNAGRCNRHTGECECDDGYEVIHPTHSHTTAHTDQRRHRQE
jgi:hypothetical protein